MGRISILLLILGFMVVSPVLADSSDDKVISGTVSSLDPAESQLNVRYTDPSTGDLDEISLRATGDSELTRGPRSIAFSDIEQGDPVSVAYYKDDASGLKIKRLSDLNQADE